MVTWRVKRHRAYPGGKVSEVRWRDSKKPSVFSETTLRGTELQISRWYLSLPKANMKPVK